MDRRRGEPDGSDRFDREYYASVTRTDHVPTLGAHWWSNRFFANRIRRALRRAGGRRVLELGCAHGHTLRLLEGHAVTYGVDISPYAVEQSRRIAPRSSIRMANIEHDLEGMFDAASFDVIFAKSVLEHLERPGEVLATCRKLLTPRGILLFVVPSTTNMLRSLKGDHWIGVRDPTHVSVLTPDEWAALLRRNGLEVTRRYSTGFWDVPYVRWLPNAVQMGLVGLPTVLALATSGSFIPPWLGENLIVEATPAES